MDQQLFQKYWQGECTQHEKEEVERWIQEHRSLDALNRNIYAAWEASNSWEIPDGVDLLRVQKKLHESLKADAMVSEEGHFSAKKKPRRFVPLQLPVAASWLIGLLLGLLTYWGADHWEGFPKEKWIAEYMPSEMQTEHVLPDGTKFWLNANSTLEYPESYSSEKRLVHLNGEAYFQVQKDPTHPFRIEMEGMEIEVLGTEFNVRAYNTENLAQVDLLEGKVRLKTRGKIIQMKPGQSLLYNKTNERFEAKRLEEDILGVWRNGEIAFRRMNLEAIAMRLSKYYGYEFTFSDSFLKKGLYTARFQDKKLAEILLTLSQTGGFEFKIDDEKQKVLLKPSSKH
ncbi:FecR domain-containing protein [Limibacter armeniacum]|uniref:FecR family protein n=1 Tax=Limibacter armeniacum TaxID=466084 RepID=UPI002FE5D503